MCELTAHLEATFMAISGHDFAIASAASRDYAKALGTEVLNVSSQVLKLLVLN